MEKKKIKRKKGTKKYFSCCGEDLSHTKRSVFLTKNNQEEHDDNGKVISKQTVFEIGKFKSQTFYKYLYKEFAKGNSYKNYASAVFYEPVLYNVAKEVCSFLDKYYNIKTEILISVNRNMKNLNKNKEKLNELTKNVIDINEKKEDKEKRDLLNYSILEFNNYRLYEKYSEKDDTIEYNKKIVEINMFLNEKIFQSKILTKKEKEEIKYLSILKGFPSFPLVEKENVPYTEEEILEKFEEFFKNNEEETIKFWGNLTVDEIKKILEQHYYPKKEKKEKEKKVNEISCKDCKKYFIKGIIE